LAGRGVPGRTARRLGGGPLRCRCRDGAMPGAASGGVHTAMSDYLVYRSHNGTRRDGVTPDAASGGVHTAMSDYIRYRSYNGTMPWLLGLSDARCSVWWCAQPRQRNRLHCSSAKVGEHVGTVPWENMSGQSRQIISDAARIIGQGRRVHSHVRFSPPFISHRSPAGSPIHPSHRHIVVPGHLCVSTSLSGLVF
jgi:hypothetical protein